MSIVSRNTVCTAVVLLFISLNPAFATELRDIRTGFHQTYSRVVIETSASTPYAVSLDKMDSTLTIAARSIVRVGNFGPVKIGPRDPLLRHIRFWRTSRGLTVAVELKQSQVRLEHRLLFAPYRIVVDIYSARPEHSTPGKKTVLDQKQPGLVSTAGPAPASPDSSTPKLVDARSLPLARMQKQPGTKRPDQRAGPDSSKQAVSAETHPPSEPETQARQQNRLSRVTIFWLLAGAFLLINTAVLILTIRRRRTKKLQRTNIRKRTQRHNTSDRPEMPSPEFLDFLKSAVENQSQAAAHTKERGDARPMGKTAKLDALIGSLSAIIKTSDTDTSVSLPPAFKEIAHDLNLATGQGEISEEEARKQLIGRDGVAFMKNIKRLYLSQ
ncbi:MAG: hypothetical protein ACE5IY_03915 [bacterium]